MSPRLNLEEIDVDGAVRESAQEAVAALDGDTRLDFMRKAGLGAGAAVSGGAVLSGLVPGTAGAAVPYGRPPSSFGKGDIGILNFALTLEYLEAAFYNEATAKGAVTDELTKLFLDQTTADENAHVKFLKGALGSKAVKTPKFDFKGTTADQALFQKTAYALENTGVHAYFGQARNIKSAKVAKAATSVLTVEARHASVIGLLTRKDSEGISPSGPFDTPFSAKKVLAAVKETGFIVG